MKHHHHYQDFQHTQYEDEYVEDSYDEYADELKEVSDSGRPNVRRSIEDYLEKKRFEEINRDPFDDEYLDEDF